MDNPQHTDFNVSSQIRRRAFVGAVFACVTIAFVGVVVIWQQYSLSNLAKKVIQEDAALSEIATGIANQVLSCRRYEKDLFLNMTDKVRRDNYLEKWQDSRETLEDLLISLDEKPDVDKSKIATWKSAAHDYQSHFLTVVAKVENGTLTTPAEGNLAMIAVKDEIRFLGREAEGFADRMSD